MTLLIGLTTHEIQTLLTETGQPAYRGKQVAEWLYRRTLPEQGGGTRAQFDAMTDLPASLRASLAENFSIDPLTVTGNFSDARDGTIKIVTALHDGPHVEAVLMPDEKRVSVCLSTQAGCPMACAFCATGTQGLARNLTAGEIVAQFLHLQSLSERRITHVVFMGMGEPMLNYEQTLKAIRILHDEIGVSMRHVTLSTVGILPGIERLAKEHLQLTLAVSLHAPSDALRARIVPVHRTYTITRLMDACRDYFAATGRRVTFEYILLRGVNDNPEQAHELAALLRGFPCAVNLIPYNPTTVAERFDRPEGERILGFRGILEEAGITVTQRKERGRQIAAACGQLATQERYKASPTARPLTLAESQIVTAREPELAGASSI